VCLVNGAYVHNVQIIERLAAVDHEARIERTEPTDLAARFDALDPGAELGLRPFLSTAQRRLDRLGCEVVIRSFDPPTLPALYLVSRAAMYQDELQASRGKADDLWGGVLDALAASAAPERPQLVLNHRNPLVRRVAALTDPELAGLAVESLYGQALMLGHHPLRPADAALLTTSFMGLLSRAVPTEEAADENR
jgi:molecular chaperone HtpG